MSNNSASTDFRAAFSYLNELIAIVVALFGLASISLIAIALQYLSELYSLLGLPGALIDRSLPTLISIGFRAAKMSYVQYMALPVLVPVGLYAAKCMMFPNFEFKFVKKGPATDHVTVNSPETRSKRLFGAFTIAIIICISAGIAIPQYVGPHAAKQQLQILSNSASSCKYVKNSCSYFFMKENRYILGIALGSDKDKVIVINPKGVYIIKTEDIVRIVSKEKNSALQLTRR